MNDLCFMSLPFQPLKTMKTPFFFSTAILAEYMANLFQGTYYLGINSLHSFKEISKAECSDFEKKFDFISNKTIYYDRSYIQGFVEMVKQLYETNDIQIMDKKTAVCECRRVEISESELARFDEDNIRMQLIESADGELSCRFCKKKLVFDTRKNLYLCFKEAELNRSVGIYPSYLDSDFNHFRKSLTNSHLRISKVQQTGVSIELDHQLFHLDIDMLWKFIPFLLKNQDVIVVASVKHIFSLFIINYLAQIVHRNHVRIIGLPFIETASVKDETLQFLADEKHRKALKLLVSLGIGWSKKSIKLQDSTCRYFMSSKTKNDDLYHFLSSIKFHTNEWCEISEIITTHTKLQNILQLKKGKGISD